MSRVLICDGCGTHEGAVTGYARGGADGFIDYCEACTGPATAFFDAALKSREKHVTAWRDELVALRAEHAPTLKAVPIPQGAED